MPWPALDIDLRARAGFPSSSSRKITTLRQTLSRGVFAAAAATGILSLSGAPALADSIAVGTTEDSSGVVAGNNIQVPV
ncbi:chaplin family protein, partial [Streptomyces griseicoloratus]|uniref:chaplin family protein n=1 Tax=Streptomyces griseicoloratus TaxID=2752516 RepID=UPI001CB70EB9